MMIEPEDPAVAAAYQPRACPKCTCLNGPRRVNQGPKEVRAIYRCWSCRRNYHVAFTPGSAIPRHQQEAE